MESFALKIGHFRIIDIGQVTASFRARVLEEAQNKQKLHKRKETQSVAEKLSKKCPLDQLEAEFFLVMEVPLDTSKEELQNMEKFAEDTKVLKKRRLAQRIANVDINRAQRLLKATTAKSWLILFVVTLLGAIIPFVHRFPKATPAVSYYESLT